MRILPLLLISLAVTPVAADGVATPANGQGCLVYQDEQSTATPRWEGPCQAGFADGEGKLEWLVRGKLDRTYTGTMKNGRAHGAGYVLTHDNLQYEGQFANGARDGFGILVSAQGDRYDGQWKAGIKEGQGKMVYATGGRYEGGWRNGQYHGKGTITYAGGRTATYDFIDGHWQDGPDPTLFGRMHDRKDDAFWEGGVKRRDKHAGGVSIPPHLSYERLTAEQKMLVSRGYALMDPRDEPPYPATGPEKLMHTIASKVDTWRGGLDVYVTVGPDGKAQSVTTVGAPSDLVTKLVSYVYMMEKYKPGKCAGTPCTMIYAASWKFASAP